MRMILMLIGICVCMLLFFYLLWEVMRELSSGRGAGNCSSELLIGFLKNPRYHLTPILKFIEDYMLDLISSGVQWGYDIPYLCTGRLNQHPRSAIAAVKEGRTDYAYFNVTLMDRD